MRLGVRGDSGQYVASRADMVWDIVYVRVVEGYVWDQQKCTHRVKKLTVMEVKLIFKLKRPKLNQMTKLWVYVVHVVIRL